MTSQHGNGQSFSLLFCTRMMNWNLRNEQIRGDNPWARVESIRIDSRERFLTLQPSRLDCIGSYQTDVVPFPEFIKQYISTIQQFGNPFSVRVIPAAIPFSKRPDDGQFGLYKPAFCR